METTYRKKSNGVVVNTNRSGLIQARRRKKILLAKEQQIISLEERLSKLESLFQEIINKDNG